MKLILKLLLLTSLYYGLSPVLSAQTVTVTGTITDTGTTPYSNGSLTVTLVNSTGQQATFGGSPSFQTTYSASLDANGSFSISLPPNSTATPSIRPAGTQWNFSYQSQGGYGAANISVTITSSGSISGTLSGLTRITWPLGRTAPPGGVGQGIVVVSSTTLGWGAAGGGTGLSGPAFSIGTGSAQAQTVQPVTPITDATLATAVATTGGFEICWAPAASNTAAAPTLAGAGTSTFSAHAIFKGGGLFNLIASDILFGAISCAIWDGTAFELQNPLAGLVAANSLTLGNGAAAAGSGATGGFAAGEATNTGWTPTAGQDYIRADTTHGWLTSVNGGAEVPLPWWATTPAGTKCVQSSGTLGIIAETTGPCGNVSTGQTNVYGAFLQDFTAGTMEIPEAAGFTTNVNSTIGLDTTANSVHLFVNNADSIAATFASAPAGTKCVHTNGTTGLLTETGTDCNTPALSAIAAATGPNTIANGNNPQTWNWAQTTDSQNGMAFGETSAATGGTITTGLANQGLFAVSTSAGSTATPFKITQGSITGTVAFPAAQWQTTWNNAGLSGEGLFFNVTNTASAATSYLLDLQVGNSRLFGVDKTGMGIFNGNAAATSVPPASAASTDGWKYCLRGIAMCVAADGPQAEYHTVNIGGNGWFSLSSANPAGNAGSASPDSAAQHSFHNSVLMDIGKEHAGCAFTNISASDFICANSTTHELTAATNGASTLGMLARMQPGSIHQTAQTAAITTATLCASAAGACNTAGNYTVEWSFTQTGTACGTPGTGGVTFLLTWTDQNGTAHSAIGLAMDDSASLVATTGTFHFTTSNATAWASGQFNISSNGSIIQYATSYTACSVGTGSYQLDAWTIRKQ